MSKSNDLSSSDSDTFESSSDTSVANTNTGTSIAPSLPVDPIVPPVPSAAPIVTQELPVVPVVPQVASTPLPAIQVASGLPVIRSISSSASVPIATQDNAVVSEGVKMATLATEPTSTVPSIPLSPSVVNGTNPAQNIVVNLTNQQPLSGCGHCSKGCTMCACGCSLDVWLGTNVVAEVCVIVLQFVVRNFGLSVFYVIQRIPHVLALVANHSYKLYILSLECALYEIFCYSFHLHLLVRLVTHTSCSLLF